MFQGIKNYREFNEQSRLAIEQKMHYFFSLDLNLICRKYLKIILKLGYNLINKKKKIDIFI